MGSYATCYLGNFEIGSTKSDIDYGLMMLFRDSDKHFVDGEGNPVPSMTDEEYEEYLCSLSDDSSDESYISIVYRAPTAVVKDRLRVLGYSLETSKQVFEKLIEFEIESTERRLRSLRAESRSEILVPHYEEELEALQQFSVDRWIESLRKIQEENLQRASSYASIERKHDDLVLNYMLTQDWYGYPGPDINIAIRLALEACSGAVELTYDVTDLVAGEYIKPNEKLVTSVGDASEDEHRYSSRIIVLTEGRTDAWILSEALNLIFPHVAEYYSFMEFEAVRFGGGAGNLANLLKAFAGAGVANRTIGLFDNDTAGLAAIDTLKQIDLPSHIRVLKLPDIDSLNSYPTLGPGGKGNLNVNGVAASIELYLGDDVLADGVEFTPIQWTGYDSKMGRYQGEVLAKEQIHARFKEKLRMGLANPSTLDAPTWDNLRTVFETLFCAFEDLDRQRSIAIAENYFLSS
jgi:hypothetical protein